MLRFLRKKRKAPNAQQFEGMAESYHLAAQENQKAKKLAHHIEQNWSAIEARQCEEYGAAHPQAADRLSFYSQMVIGYPKEMAETIKGDPLFALFEKARHSRLLAYHLYQIVDRLEEELTQCTRVALQQFVIEALVAKKHIAPGMVSWKSLRRKELEHLFAHEQLMSNLQKLSLELAAIMVFEIKRAVSLLEETLQNPDLQKEPIAFEQEVGLEALQIKIMKLHKLAAQQDVHHLKEQLLALANHCPNR